MDVEPVGAEVDAQHAAVGERMDGVRVRTLLRGQRSGALPRQHLLRSADPAIRSQGRHAHGAVAVAGGQQRSLGDREVARPHPARGDPSERREPRIRPRERCQLRRALEGGVHHVAGRDEPRRRVGLDDRAEELEAAVRMRTGPPDPLRLAAHVRGVPADQELGHCIAASRVT